MRHVALLFITLLALGCPSGGGDDDDDATARDDDDSAAPADDDDSAEPPTPPDTGTGVPCTEPAATQCVGDSHQECIDGYWRVLDACEDAICDADLGCVDCVPEVDWCEGQQAWGCSALGESELLDTCTGSDQCVSGACVTQCRLAEERESYLGCEFFAVTSSNFLDAAFDQDFAVVVANPAGGSSATVEIHRGASLVATEQVPSGETRAIELPMVLELKDAWESVQLADGAYEVVSSEPVAAYQFNPLHFELNSQLGYTNDASLLLPAHSLDLEYRTVNRATFASTTTDGSLYVVDGVVPGKFDVVATEDGTTVTVESAGRTGEGTPAAMDVGDTVTVTLDRGDVLQVMSEIPTMSGANDECLSLGYEQATHTCGNNNHLTCQFCTMPDTDLTGTRITASAPVATFSGSRCTYVPFDRPTCDHLEDMVPPLSTWGQEVVLTAPLDPDGTDVITRLVRVLADEDATDVSFNPPVHPDTTLDAGEWLEFESDEDFVVQATQRMLVTEFLASHSNRNGSTLGDPSMVIAVPTEQFRSTYSLLTPTTFTSDHANVAAPTGVEVRVDGSLITAWEPVGATGWSVARIDLDEGVHELESVSAFSVVGYGYAEYASYAYPGGLNLGRL